jgi:hypothetical protein
MKYLFLFGCSLLLQSGLSAQGYIDVDSARRLARLEASLDKKFMGMRTLDRFYSTTGLFDSSAFMEKEMFGIAKQLKRDSMMVMVYRAMGNRYVIKTDYNFAILNYAKGLEYTARDKQRRASLYLNLAYVYIVTGNTEIALDYIRKGRLIGQAGQNLYFENLLLSFIYNNLGKPDSSLFYSRQAENVPVKINDPLLISVFMLQTARAYELNGDSDLAETYYKRTMAYCKEKYLPSSIIRTGNAYCDFLVKNGKHREARQMALEDLDVARKAGINEGISTVAEVLRKLYTHAEQKDSIIYYAQLQIAYKDSVSNQKKQSEFQNLTFIQQLRDIDEQTKATEAEEQRKQNLQYAIIALGIILFVLFFLMLSHRVITNVKIIRFLSVIALLIVFEFLNLLLHPFLERVTHHLPVLMLFSMVCIAALLVPLHHQLEKWSAHRLVEKNKQVRLASAKRTIEKLERREEEKDQRIN